MSQVRPRHALLCALIAVAAGCSRGAAEAARAQVAHLLGAGPREILFTSGATEANVLALRGTYDRGAGAHLVRDLIGHKTLAMSNRYVGKMVEPVRDLREQVAGSIEAALRGKPKAEIVEINPAQIVRGDG